LRSRTGRRDTKVIKAGSWGGWHDAQASRLTVFGRHGKNPIWLSGIADGKRSKTMFGIGRGLAEGLTAGRLRMSSL